MTLIASSLFWILVVIAVYNAVVVFSAIALLRRKPDLKAPEDKLPRAAVLLCVRGADPTLESGLRRLLAQDYPDFEIFIAVDSESDPAWFVVQRIVGEECGTRVHVSALQHRSKTCGLKCSSLVQLTGQLDDSFEIIVLADSDLESHATWLSELAAPFAEPRTGATFGNRWFLPAQGKIGSLIRQQWNGPVVVTMALLGIPWGGSLAIRSSLFRSGKIRDTWSRSIVDDCPVRNAVLAAGMKVRFVPSVMMANREECSTGFAFNFIRRQLLWTRLYVKSGWPIILAYSVGTVVLPMAALMLGLAYLVIGNWASARLLFAGLAVVVGTFAVLQLLLDAQVRKIIRMQGEPADPVWPKQFARTPIGIVLAGIVHAVAMVLVTFQNEVVWRGARYRVDGPTNVQLLDDQPVRSEGEISSI